MPGRDGALCPPRAVLLSAAPPLLGASSLVCGAGVDASFGGCRLGDSAAGVGACRPPPSLSGDIDGGAVPGELVEVLVHSAGGEVRPSTSSPPVAAACSLLSLIGDHRRRVGAAARVRPPVAISVRADFYAAHHRMRSVLARGLKVRVPVLVPPVWRVTPRSRLMSAAVEDCVAAGVLRLGRPVACYRLFPVAKSETVARLVYDMSELTPFLPDRPCVLPSAERALALSFEGFKYAVKIDLRDGFFHIPLAPSTQNNFGVSYGGKTYVFTRLPMGLKVAPAEMQLFSSVTVKLVEERFPGVKGMAYIDDFLFLARGPAMLDGVCDFLTEVGLCINLDKSVIVPATAVTFLGVLINLIECSAQVKSEVIVPLRSALSRCSADWPLMWRQRLAGFVNFVRPFMKLPLEIVKAVRDGDHSACEAAMPYVSEVTVWRYSDRIAWSDMHERVVYVDATPTCIGIVRPGCVPLSINLEAVLPIYVAEYAAALVAVALMSSGEPFTIFSDNIGVCYNLDKGRCPRSWLNVLLGIFQKRNFSIAYIPTHCNPADAPSRAISW